MILDDFEVALFLRESRTRHSLLTRHKHLNRPNIKHSQTEPTEGVQPDTGILVESDSESEMNLNNIPKAGSDDAPESQHSKQMQNKPLQDEPESEDKKMRFRTNYEGFNIYGWMLCLLVTRKGEKGKARAEEAEPRRQALMEDWISTQAQGDVDEE